MEPIKYKDDAIFVFKNYKVLYMKYSGCQLKVFHIDGGAQYMREFNYYFKENSITHKVTASYSPEQNRKVERVNHIIIGLIQAILAL